MKAIKIALLGTAALAAVSASARADQLSDLKAQIEALNARVAQVETAPSLPAGYQMVSFSKEGNNHIISIMPTADMPAATTVTWSGYVRAGVITGKLANVYATDIITKAKLNVTGKTDTAVGEVGVSVNLISSSTGWDTTNTGNNGVTTDGYWGWWKVTPNMTFGGGVGGSISKNNYTYDATSILDWTNDAFGGISASGLGDPSQFKLSYADGPLSFAVAVEDSNNTGNTSAFGVAGNVGYVADQFGIDLSGGYTGNAGGYLNGTNGWSLTGGVQANFSPFVIGGALGFGHDIGKADFTRGSAYIHFALSDMANIELGATHDFTNNWTEYDVGLYYSPVSKLTMGIEGLYQAGTRTASYNDGAYTAAFLTQWAF